MRPPPARDQWSRRPPPRTGPGRVGRPLPSLARALPYVSGRRPARRARAAETREGGASSVPRMTNHARGPDAPGPAAGDPFHDRHLRHPGARRPRAPVGPHPRAVPRALGPPQPPRDRGHAGAVRPAVGLGLVGALGEPLARRRHRARQRGLPRAALRDPARLRPRGSVPQPAARRLDGPRARRADADALRRLAPPARGAPRHRGQPRPSRHGRGLSP